MPTMAEMRIALARRANPVEMKNIGVNEAPGLSPKAYMSPGGVNMPAITSSSMPTGGVDMGAMTPGHQMLPQSQAPQMQPVGAQGLQGGPTSPVAPGAGPRSNILQMTPQGQAMEAMAPQGPPVMPGMQGEMRPQALAKGGSAKFPPVAIMKRALAEGGEVEGEGVKSGVTMQSPGSTRLVFQAEGPGGVKGINVPRHMWEGSSGVYKEGKRAGQPFKIAGMKEVNEARAKVYGLENRDPLKIGQIGEIHRQVLEEHFKKPKDQQISAENAALQRLRDAKHIGEDSNTLDKSEKLDTVRHEHDEEGRSYEGLAAKGVAGHALYTSGHGKNMKHHVLNTCPGQTIGCGGGVDQNGMVDTTRGTCFAPVAEAQYPAASVRRACHAQAKHDPKMTKDWILAHTGSIREAAEEQDKKGKRLLFRPNVVDETDVSSRHVIRHLNKQREEEHAEDKAAFDHFNELQKTGNAKVKKAFYKAYPEGKFVPKAPIIANSYGKTTELHDPENGYYVTHSNVGPKVKLGKSIHENVLRDLARIRSTITATTSSGADVTNDNGNKTPPKGSYMVTDVKRGSPLNQKMEKAIKYAKYWSIGRLPERLSDEEKAEGPEGHFGPKGEPTTPEKAHFGHITLNGKRYDYQKQHILHPRLVNVPERKKNKKTGEIETVDHYIPTDSRFKDEEFLPKNRFMTKNGKKAGHILMTTPTTSTSNAGHQTSFTHNVSEKHIEHALKNNGEYEIDPPHEQEKAAGKEYIPPQPIKFMAGGGSVRPTEDFDEHHQFPEQSYMAQAHLAHRMDPEEAAEIGHVHKRSRVPVKINRNPDTMRLELLRKGK